MSQTLSKLLQEIRACTVCQKHLSHPVRPVLRASATAKILVIGQAPGTKVHASGVPWNDPSGVRLRQWMGVDEETFYDERRIAIVPMGFCYPGKGKSGDLPPRPECAPLWHERLRQEMPKLKLFLLIGQYAQAFYLPNRKKTLTETVKAYKEYSPPYFVLPHPSPRNLMWFRRNPWFEENVLPNLKQSVAKLLS